MYTVLAIMIDSVKYWCSSKYSEYVPKLGLTCAFLGTFFLFFVRVRRKVGCAAHIVLHSLRVPTFFFFCLLASGLLRVTRSLPMLIRMHKAHAVELISSPQTVVVVLYDDTTTVCLRSHD